MNADASLVERLRSLVAGALGDQGATAFDRALAKHGGGNATLTSEQLAATLSDLSTVARMLNGKSRAEQLSSALQHEIESSDGP